MSGPEDNPADEHQPTKEEWEAKMGQNCDGVALLPCPFCGERASAVESEEWGNRARCVNCCAEADLRRWNTRAAAPTQAGGEAAMRTMFDAHQRMREERDRAIGALLCATWQGCLTFDRACELLGMSTVQLRAEANRIFTEEKA